MAVIVAPSFATGAPDRAVGTREVAGRPQVTSWDVATGQHRQLTRAPLGVDLYEIEPDGRHVWWFDAGSDGTGSWRRAPFEGGPDLPALAGVPAGRGYGVAFDGPGRLAAVGVGVAGWSRCYLGTPGGDGRLLLRVPGYRCVVDLSPDGALLVLAGPPDSADAALLVDAGSGRILARVAGGPDRRVWPLGFRAAPRAAPSNSSPRGSGLDGREPDGPELLLVVAGTDGYVPASWRPGRGTEVHGWLRFGSEITASWYGTGRTLLVQHDRAGRSRLLVARLDQRESAVLATPPGSITEVGSTPDGLVHYLWSRAGTPPRPLVAAPGRAAPAVPGGPVPHHRELWTRQPYGRIHTLLATPPDRPGPWPLLFLVHGGPATHDRDEYDPRVEAFTGAGYAVARVNYRGSTGYGPVWQRTDPHRVGLDQLDDLAAVRRHLLALGVATPDRTGLCGWSWGGYLTLLAMGAQPRLWSVGMAVSPVADYVAAYRATTPALREVDRELFGGDPEQVPARYRSASPMTYVDGVRGPVLVVAGADDEKCPLPQVRGYTGALRARGVPHRLELVGGGHQPRDAAGLAAVLSNMLRYARDAMTGPRPEPAGNGRR